jgi:FAD/FMN-containing dehydrogenase
VPPTATAFPHREPGFNLAIAGVWPDPAGDDENIAWVKETFDAVSPYMADSVYVNYLGDGEADRVRAAYGPCWERLVEVKRRYDPGNVFHLNQNITP